MAWGLPFVPVPPDEQSDPQGGRARVRYLVLAVDVAEQHAAETIYRVRVRQAGAGAGAEHQHTEPTYVHFVSQRTGRDVPHDVGAILELDPRLVDRE